MINIKVPTTIPKEKVSVIKVVAGNKFFIGKTASITWFAGALKEAYGKYVYRNGLREDNMFYPIVKHIHKSGIEDIYIDVIFSSDDGYKVLKSEFEQLSQHFGTKGCINTNNQPIVPKTSYNEANKSKWLTVVQSLNYYKFLKRSSQLHQ
jgi:hypothetical protein